MERARSRAAARLQLRLYVAGHAPNSLAARASLTAICESLAPGTHALDVVDVLEQPQRALADGIIVTPTLVRFWPLPEQRLVGSLSDPLLVRRILEVT